VSGHAWNVALSGDRREEGGAPYRPLHARSFGVRTNPLAWLQSRTNAWQGIVTKAVGGEGAFTWHRLKGELQRWPGRKWMFDYFLFFLRLTNTDKRKEAATRRRRRERTELEVTRVSASFELECRYRINSDTRRPIRYQEADRHDRHVTTVTSQEPFSGLGVMLRVMHRR
jgi:hypothetical protein